MVHNKLHTEREAKQYFQMFLVLSHLQFYQSLALNISLFHQITRLLTKLSNSISKYLDKLNSFGHYQLIFIIAIHFGLLAPNHHQY